MLINEFTKFLHNIKKNRQSQKTKKNKNNDLVFLKFQNSYSL